MNSIEAVYLFEKPFSFLGKAYGNSADLVKAFCDNWDMGLAAFLRGDLDHYFTEHVTDSAYKIENNTKYFIRDRRNYVWNHLRDADQDCEFSAVVYMLEPHDTAKEICFYLPNGENDTVKENRMIDLAERILMSKDQRLWWDWTKYDFDGMNFSAFVVPLFANEAIGQIVAERDSELGEALGLCRSYYPTYLQSLGKNTRRKKENSYMDILREAAEVIIAGKRFVLREEIFSDGSAVRTKIMDCLARGDIDIWNDLYPGRENKRSNAWKRFLLCQNVDKECVEAADILNDICGKLTKVEEKEADKHQVNSANNLSCVYSWIGNVTQEAIEKKVPISEIFSEKIAKIESDLHFLEQMNRNLQEYILAFEKAHQIVLGDSTDEKYFLALEERKQKQKEVEQTQERLATFLGTIRAIAANLSDPETFVQIWQGMLQSAEEQIREFSVSHRIGNFELKEKDREWSLLVLSSICGMECVFLLGAYPGENGSLSIAQKFIPMMITYIERWMKREDCLYKEWLLRSVREKVIRKCHEIFLTTIKARYPKKVSNLYRNLCDQLMEMFQIDPKNVIDEKQQDLVREYNLKDFFGEIYPENQTVEHYIEQIKALDRECPVRGQENFSSVEKRFLHEKNPKYQELIAAGKKYCEYRDKLLKDIRTMWNLKEGPQRDNLLSSTKCQKLVAPYVSNCFEKTKQIVQSGLDEMRRLYYEIAAHEAALHRYVKETQEEEERKRKKKEEEEAKRAAEAEKLRKKKEREKKWRKAKPHFLRGAILLVVLFFFGKLFFGSTYYGLPLYGGKYLSYKEYSIAPFVKKIRNNAFNGAKKLESITIPEKVHSIGENSFANCSNLKEIILNDYLSENYSFSVSNLAYGAGALGEKNFEILTPDGELPTGYSSPAQLQFFMGKRNHSEVQQLSMNPHLDRVQELIELCNESNYSLDYSGSVDGSSVSIAAADFTYHVQNWPTEVSTVDDVNFITIPVTREYHSDAVQLAQNVTVTLFAEGKFGVREVNFGDCRSTINSEALCGTYSITPDGETEVSILDVTEDYILLSDFTSQSLGGNSVILRNQHYFPWNDGNRMLCPNLSSNEKGSSYFSVAASFDLISGEFVIDGEKYYRTGELSLEQKARKKSALEGAWEGSYDNGNKMEAYMLFLPLKGNKIWTLFSFRKESNGEGGSYVMKSHYDGKKGSAYLEEWEWMDSPSGWSMISFNGVVSEDNTRMEDPEWTLEMKKKD